MAERGLTTPQLEALLDILVHYETYAEVQSFRKAESIETYGWPFIDQDVTGRRTKSHDTSSSPLLQLLLTKLVLGAPAVRDLTQDFWQVKFKGLMKQLGDADLSDSYEKGTLGTRKRLATAASVIHEGVTKGLLSGISHEALPGLPNLHRPYDSAKADELSAAWHDCLCQLAYGNLLDDIFEQLTQTDQLEAHSPAVRAAIEYAELHLATFLHNVFIVSSEGQDLLILIENVHKLVPYTVIGQTLRVGNAASMINAMSRLVLSKVSVGAISNWIGLTSNAADGMNLMQRIISLVLDWDAADFRKAVEKLKQRKGELSSEHIAAIDKHLSLGQNRRDAVRQKSIQEQKSIILTIFEAENKQLAESMTEKQHTLCLEYYATRLAVRDREKLTDVLCNSSPDLVTAIVSDGVAALDPMIRAVHKNVDIRKHLNAVEAFISDFVKTTRSGPQYDETPSVKDLVQLLRRHRRLLWVYLHEFCSGCPDLRDIWREWMKDSLKTFRQPQSKTRGAGQDKNTLAHDRTHADLGDMGVSRQLSEIYEKLSESQKQNVLEQIEAHSNYLSSLKELSRGRMQSVIDNLGGKNHGKAKDISGPGVYASRWQSLLDETLITPSVPKGLPRRGKDVKGARAVGKLNDADLKDKKKKQGVDSSSPSLTPPYVSDVVGLVGPQFKMMVAELAREGLSPL
ncbi:hypothetical protein GGS20DRAFT_593761 [Poronia punctata]|nr:hypothetical protein GGS20DRAFT_593761 [Poronia punctata]